jgi:hypothetical protein
MKTDEPYVIPPKSLNRLEERNALLARPDSDIWIVKDMFEKGEIHLLSGPSGVGKSTWLMTMIHDWSIGLDVLGHKSYPAPFAYIVCDRSFALTAMTLDRVGLSKFNIPMFTIDELKREMGDEVLTLQRIADFIPYVKVFFIEAIGYFEPSSNGKAMGYTENLKYWGDIRNRYAAKGLTIVATTHSPKAKGKDRYGHSRERVMGSAAHGAAVATIITFDFADEEKSTDKGRIMNISPRNSPNQVLRFSLDDKGCYIYKNAFESEAKDNETSIDSLKVKLSTMFPGQEFGPEFIKGFIDETGFSRAQVFRSLKDLLELGVIKSVGIKGSGKYQICRIPKKVTLQ